MQYHHWLVLPVPRFETTCIVIVLPSWVENWFWLLSLLLLLLQTSKSYPMKNHVNKYLTCYSVCYWYSGRWHWKSEKKQCSVTLGSALPISTKFLPDGIEDTEHECQKCKDVELISLCCVVLTLGCLSSSAVAASGEKDDLRRLLRLGRLTAAATTL